MNHVDQIQLGMRLILSDSSQFTIDTDRSHGNLNIGTVIGVGRIFEILQDDGIVADRGIAVELCNFHFPITAGNNTRGEVFYPHGETSRVQLSSRDFHRHWDIVADAYVPPELIDLSDVDNTPELIDLSDVDDTPPAPPPQPVRQGEGVCCLAGDLECTAPGLFFFNCTHTLCRPCSTKFADALVGQDPHFPRRTFSCPMCRSE